jgi:hypothetical protein
MHRWPGLFISRKGAKRVAADLRGVLGKIAANLVQYSCFEKHWPFQEKSGLGNEKCANCGSLYDKPTKACHCDKVFQRKPSVSSHLVGGPRRPVNSVLAVATPERPVWQLAARRQP